MNAVIAVNGSRAARKAVTAVALVATLGVATACMDDRGGPSNQTTGTVAGAAVGGLIGGLAFNSVGGVVGGALVGAIAGNLVGRALDDQERRRLAEATQHAFTAETNQPTTYTVDKTASASGSVSATNAPTGSAQTSSAPPTVVSAKPVGPAAQRSDGSTCRPIEMTATKNGQTTTETTTFCQAAGSTELKAVKV